MRRLFVSAVVATVSVGLLTTQSSNAADMPIKATAPVSAVKKAPSWSGFYAGLNAGYSFSNVNRSVNYLPSGPLFGMTPFAFDVSSRGFLGGVQAGYNWQINRAVYGIETDLAFANVKADGFSAPLFNAGGVVLAGSYYADSSQMKWFGTFRARAGVLATDSLLVYATGGAAYARIKYDALTNIDPTAPILQWSGSSSKTKFGWTLGAGAEWKAEGPWSLKAEYLYYDLGTESLVGDRVQAIAPPDPFKVVSEFKTRGNLVRIGVNYYFN